MINDHACNMYTYNDIQFKNKIDGSIIHRVL